jgi:hypothetical protein
VTLLTFAMVTVAANKLIGEITDRMPAVIPPEHWGTWLGVCKAPIGAFTANRLDVPDFPSNEVTHSTALLQSRTEYGIAVTVTALPCAGGTSDVDVILGFAVHVT